MMSDLETAMTALFTHLQDAARIEFAADLTAGEATLTAVSSTAGLFAGLPVFGPGIAQGAAIAEIDADAAMVTLTMPAEADGAAVTLRTGFLTTGRRVLHWQQVAAQPALFLRRIGMLDEADQLFTVTTLECEAWIYCNAGLDPELAPDSALTGLEKMVRDSFAPDGDYGDPRFTLGGLVHWCRIEGRSDISPGDQGPQAIARIPIRITLP